MESPIQMDDLGPLGVPPHQETSIYNYILFTQYIKLIVTLYMYH